MDGIARYIERAVLKPGVTPQEIAAACAEVEKHGFRGLCVNSGRAAGGIRPGTRALRLLKAGGGLYRHQRRADFCGQA
ncbi:MAG: hypothetical protein LBO03_07460 [Acidaminococcales bacterium]|nr:hypothetical protein [Acidaminococcales bacterium]